MALTDNLSAYCKMDETTVNRYDSYGNSHLTEINNPTSVSGKMGNAYYAEELGGDNDRGLKTTSNSNLQLGQEDWSLLTWTYFISQPAANFDFLVLSKGWSTFNYYLHAKTYSTDPNRWTLTISTTLGAYTIQGPGTGATAYKIGQWQMMVGRYRASDRFLDLWVDNQLAASGNASADITTESNDLTFGGTTSAGTFAINTNCSLYMDTTVLWKRRIADIEIDQLWNSGNGLDFYPLSISRISQAIIIT